jgi:hypothetical protein
MIGHVRTAALGRQPSEARQSSQMHESLITIAIFHSQPEFLLARTRLESADIECFAYDENMLRIGGWHSHVLGGIKLQVRESEAQDARAILYATSSDNP